MGRSGGQGCMGMGGQHQGSRRGVGGARWTVATNAALMGTLVRLPMTTLDLLPPPPLLSPSPSHVLPSSIAPCLYLSQVLPGQACEQVLGSCSCDNGRLLPGGCDPSASSTWWGALGGNATSPQQPLPPGLFLTCGVNASHAGQDAHRQLTGEGAWGACRCGGTCAWAARAQEGQAE